MGNPARRYQRPPDSPAGGNHVRRHGYGGGHLEVDGHPIPYIALVDQDPEQMRKDYGLDRVEAAEWADQGRYRASLQLREAIERGEPCYAVLGDERFMLEPVPESEINRWAWFLANAMAVSAGYTSHGENSRPINRHGPSRI